MKPTLNGALRATTSIVLLLTLAACATTPSPTATTPLVTTSPTATDTPLQTMTPAEAKVAFEKIAKDSCFLAQKLGEVETVTTPTGSTVVVMTNKSEAYQDFNAAYFVAPDEYTLIWEIDGLTACGAYYTFSMAEEAGQPAAIDVVFRTTDSVFETTEDLGQFGVNHIDYTVTDGIISIAKRIDPKNPSTTSVKYGNLTETERNIIKTAVDRYLASLSQ